ncbi:MAG TPA: polysaccharide biosynthesis tyrosine autokinase [Nocardioides sp.]|nr:polysaccharide biosynthesis tyrosine autokinase [Nocardioides sp.]
MDFKQFLHVLRRRWITIVVVVAVALGIAAIVNWRATPEYESKSRVFIGLDLQSAADATGSLFLLTGRVQSYADLADSSDLMNQVISDLNLQMTPSELADKIEAEVVQDTTLIDLQVVDEDPSEAQAIARVHARRLTEYLSDLETPSDSDSTRIVARVTDSASYNGSPVSPRTWLNFAVAGLIGLLIGVAAAVSRHILDRTVSSQEHVQEVTDKPVLASIGYDASIKKHPLLTDLGSFAPRTEAFRVLRTNLQFLDLDHQPRCLVISSALQGEGKTMTSTNLAIALAQTGRRTLLIDGDLRRPRVAGLLGLDAAVGLTTVLVGNTDVQEAIQVHDPSGLHFLASGAKPPNPTEILQSRVTQELIRELSDSYDMVIIDGPPLLPVADASVLATIADGVILVIQHGKTTRDAVADAVTRLEQVGGRLFGIAVNMIPKRATGGYYYYYYEESTRPARKPAKEPRRAPRETRPKSDEAPREAS